ncbi:hypothetical protein VD0004_g9657 [Verticillium dahliae]|nr:hypothetical protein VD0004_g9657 [Verticillium dahliae]PNH71199.1 hypothetical protein VD0001_g6357 [Verticillium dahliae]
MATENDTINVASDEEGRNGVEQRRLRPRKPSSKAIENQTIDDTTDDAEITTRKPNRRNARAALGGRPSVEKERQVDDDTSRLAKQEPMKQQTKLLKAVLVKLQSLAELIEDLQDENRELKRDLLTTKDKLHMVTEQMTEQAQSIRGSAEAIATMVTGQQRSEPSYADIARMPPTSRLDNAGPGPTAPPGPTDVVFCTIDTSRIEDEQDEQLTPGAVRTLTEGEVRVDQSQSDWRCLAVTKDPKKPRIRIACRNEEEHTMVKRLVGAKLPRGARMLRDELYPVKVDYVSRTVVVDEANAIRSGAAEEIGKENDV